MALKRITCSALLLVLTLASASMAVAAPRVWFDEGHAQTFTVGAAGELQLSSLAEVFRAEGWEVASGARTLTPELLVGYEALVISGPFTPLAPGEIAAVLGFIRDGGRLAVMLHIGPPLAGLLQPLGVVHSNGAIQETTRLVGGEPLNFRAELTTPHPVTAGLESFTVYGCWALLAEGEQTEVLARSSAESWIDLNGNRRFDAGDARQAFAVLVHGRLGRGAYLVFGDDALFQNRFLEGENLALAHNLAVWLQHGAPAGAVAMRRGAWSDER